MLRNGKEIVKQDNLVVDQAAEIVLQALLGEEAIRGVEFGFSGGKPVTAGLKVMPTPVGYAPTGTTAETRPFVTRDDAGLRTIGTWQAQFSPENDIDYDTLGLVSGSNRLFAATSFPTVSLSAGENIEVEWTILLRGGST